MQIRLTPNMLMIQKDGSPADPNLMSNGYTNKSKTILPLQDLINTLESYEYKTKSNTKQESLMSFDCMPKPCRERLLYTTHTKCVLLTDQQAKLCLH